MIIILCDNTECVHNRRKVCSHPFPILVENMSIKQIKTLISTTSAVTHIECKTFSEDSISPNIEEVLCDKCKACGHMNSEICNTCLK